MGRKKRAGGGKGWRGKKGIWNDQSHTVVRARQLVAPDEMDVSLKYPIGGTLLNAAGTLKAQRWTPNAAYDVDPVLGSTSTPGFAEWATLYTYYRVVSYSVSIVIVNLETFPISVFSINSNIDPGTTGGSWRDYQAEPYCKYGVVAGSSGINKIRFFHKISCSKLLGSASVQQADSMRSLVTGVPADLLYYGIGLFAVTGANMTNGVYYQGNIQMNIKFYARVNVLTSFKSLHDAQEVQRQKEKLERQLKKASDLSRPSTPF